MIGCLRAAALLVNIAVPAAPGFLLGWSWPWSVASVAFFFALSWWACALHPTSGPAPPELVRAALRVTASMGAPAPRFLRMVPEKNAAAVRAGLGYGLLVGDGIEAGLVNALVAHEVAHALSGDLLWEPLTDGPARLLLALARINALFWVVAFPFLIFGAPLARLTELRADALAAGAVQSYPSVLKEVMSSEGGRGSLLYPSLGRRIRHAARHSRGIGREST